MPDADISVTENLWDFATTGTGLAVGGIVGHAPGAVVGAAATLGDSMHEHFKRILAGVSQYLRRP